MLATSLFLACDKPEPSVPTPPVVQDTIFEMMWATRMDFEKEIVNLNNSKHYKDWYLYTGDLGFPPTIMAFNKATGDKDWEYIHEGSVQDEIDVSYVFDNIYIGMCSGGIVGVDLDNRTSLWEIDLKAMNMIRGQKLIEYEGKLYSEISWASGTPSVVYNIMEINPKSGSYQMVYSSSGGDTSPPAFFKDAETNEVSIIFNEYPDNSRPPENTTQNIKRVNLVTGDTIWSKKSFTQNFASNVLHPPIIYNDIVITGGDWHIYAFDVKTGDSVWKTSISDDSPFSIFTKTNHLIHDGRLYVNENGENVTCLNPETGEIIWNNPKGGPNCTDNMLYYEKEDFLVFTSWGYGSVMILDAFTGELIHRERRFDNSSYNNDVVYDKERDMFFTSSYKHAIGFKIRRPK